jgi:hypothetical protein
VRGATCLHGAPCPAPSPWISRCSTLQRRLAMLLNRFQSLSPSITPGSHLGPLVRVMDHGCRHPSRNPSITDARQHDWYIDRTLVHAIRARELQQTHRAACRAVPRPMPRAAARAERRFGSVVTATDHTASACTSSGRGDHPWPCPCMMLQPPLPNTAPTPLKHSQTPLPCPTHQHH